MKRRKFLTASTGAAMAVLPLTSARAQDWRQQVPEIRFSVRANENAEGMSRWNVLGQYLELELKQKVTVRPAADYAGTVEALRSRRLEIALLGGAGYAQAWINTNGNVEPLVQIAGPDGDTGYYSMIVVKADSPFQTIDDLRGKKIVFPDPNSTSGFQVPTFFLRHEGRDHRTFFSQSGFAGNHENAVMSVFNGTYDAAATWFTTEERTNVTRMIAKNMIPRGSMRMVWRSPKIEGDAFVARADLPPAFKAAYREALLALPQKAPEVLRALGDGTFTGMVATSHEHYSPLIEMTRENLAARRGS